MNNLHGRFIKTWCNQKNIVYFLIVLVFLIAFSPFHALKDHLTADDASYLSHGFTFGLDYNLKYEGMVADWKNKNHTAAAHPIGPGVLAAPFIAAFSLIDKMAGNEVITHHAQYHYSWSYFGFAFASCFFFLFGLFLYAKALDNLSFRLARWHFLLVSSSFGLLFYVLMRPVMGHSFEFFTIALCFLTSTKMLKEVIEHKKISYLNIFVCALSIILTLQIRPSDINVILLPAIVFGFFFATNSNVGKPVDIKKMMIYFPILLGAMVLAFLPFAYINQQIYGMVYPSFDAMYEVATNPIPSIHTSEDFLNTLITLIKRLPQLLVICFSSEFGLAFSSAFLFFGTIFCFYYLMKNIKDNTWKSLIALSLSAAYVGLPVAIIFFWQSVGDAYGYRFLYCLFPIALLGYGFWKKNLAVKYGEFQNYVKSAKLLQVVILFLCIFGLLGSIFFGVNSNLMYKPNVNNSFGKEGGGAVGYNKAVLQAIPKTATWVNLMATRTPGFFFVGLSDLISLDLEKLNIPKALSEKMQKYKCCYEHPPFAVYLQSAILGICFIGGCILLIRRDFAPHMKNQVNR